MSEIDNAVVVEEVKPVTSAVVKKPAAKKRPKRKRPSRPVTPKVQVAEVPQVEEPAPVKHKITTPWKPARRLDLPKDAEERIKKEGKVPRWVNKNILGNVDKKLSEGWEFDKGPVSVNRTINDGKPIDGTTHVAELVLMKTPKENADSRNKYYTDRANNPLKDPKGKLKNEIGDSGDAYGGVTTDKEYRRI